MKTYKLALVGLGSRANGLYHVLRHREYVDIVGVCDLHPERAEAFADKIEEDGRHRPAAYTDYRACLDTEKPDVVVIATSWIYHLEISIYAMEHGIVPACEVGGAYSIHSLWELVRTYERTRTPIMLLENACYHRIKLLALNMKRAGCFGELVHCEGSYRHDLREQICNGRRTDHYRLDEYIHRNGENYPTHEIGPIAKLLDIGCGNRFISLVSMGSKSVGLPHYVADRGIEELAGVRFMQSDVVTTMIKCQNGETVVIALDTSLPRYYSRGFVAEGTKGMISEDVGAVYLDRPDAKHITWDKCAGNLDEYYARYEHRFWQKGGASDAHGGIDTLEFDDFFRALDEGAEMPIDVYDMATWMAITTLSEESIATGNAVAFPDFTDGKWMHRKNTFAL